MRFIYEIAVDATHQHAASLPWGLTGVFGYGTGTPDIEWTAKDKARFPYAHVLMYDQSATLQGFASGKDDIADVERGAGTLSAFIRAAQIRKGRRQGSALYINYAVWEAAELAVVSAHLVSEVSYGIANWNWSMTEAIAFMEHNVSVRYVQFASPASNPRTLVPGTNKTLAEIPCDLSVKRADWWPAPVPYALGWRE